MTEEMIKDMIRENLNIPAIEFVEPLTTPCATYNIYYEDAILTGDGEETEIRQAVQIDLWLPQKQRQQLHELARSLKEIIMKDKNNSIPMLDYSIDQVNGVCRAIIRFDTIGG